MLKSLLEYIEQVSEETNPVNTILAVSELIRKDADSEDRPAKIRMFTFINDLKNAGLNISYEGLKAYYDASPQLQNVISQFNDEEVIFLSHSGDDQADITPEPTGDIPPEKKVNQMAKAALAKREGQYEPGTKKMQGGTNLNKFLGKSDDDDEKYIQKIEPQGKNTLGRVPFARRTVNDDIELSEKCWDGYQKKGMKTMFGKRVPNCVKKEDIEVDLDERELSKPEKSKMKKYEKKVPKEEFIKRYGKDKGEMVYYGTLTNMAKDNA